MGINPRRLLDFLSVSRHGSFSGAAQATNASQPGLSQSIAQLEHGLGVRVFERDRHGVQLTQSGQALTFHAKALESLLERAQEEMRLRALGIEGPLAIGITPIAAASLVPEALAVLLRETPKVSVTVVEGLDDEIVAMLRSRELDLVISRVGPQDSDLEVEPLITSDWALITQPRHPLAALSEISLKEVGNVQWVLPAGGSAFRRQIESVFTSAAVRWPNHGITTNSILAIKAFVMTSDCVTIMSPSLVEIECAAGRLRATPLTDVGPLRPVGMIWQRDFELSPIAARFAKVLRFVAAEYSQL